VYAGPADGAPGFDPTNGMAELVDTVVAGTRTAAELLGLADELGTVQPGKIADLVVCAGDPLGDITLLGKPENVVAVVQAGVVRRNAMPTT
jgi:imidazolonepropionase-like amidohydrolase